MTRGVVVRDVMSAPVTVARDHDPAWRALVRFTENVLRHLVVLDEAGSLVGVLDDRRVLSRWPFDAVSLHRQTTGELVHGLPVVDHAGVVVGEQAAQAPAGTRQATTGRGWLP